jgi:hypothetical protein
MVVAGEYFFFNGGGWQMMLNTLSLIPVVSRIRTKNAKFNLPFGLFHLWHKLRLCLCPQPCSFPFDRKDFSFECGWCCQGLASHFLQYATPKYAKVEESDPAVKHVPITLPIEVEMPQIKHTHSRSCTRNDSQ